MITETESGLTSGQYAAIQAATENLAIEVRLQRYGPVWTSHDTSPTRSGSNFDAAIASTYLLRCYVGSLSDVEVERLADESGGDQSWTSVTCTLSDVDTGVPPSLVTNGLTARIFYYSTGGKIRYSECADISSGSFGAAQDVATVSGVVQLAAVSTTKFYYITEDSSTLNRRLRFYKYNGSWAATSSDIYWPFYIYGFDAVSLTGFDLLMMSTELAPMLGSRVVDGEITTKTERVQGIVAFRVQNGRWSDHELIDVIDRVETQPSRAKLRLSYVNSILFATYTRCGGDGDYTYSKLAVSRSKDSISWEFPELAETSNAPGLVLPRSDYLYLVGVDRTLRSPCCAWAGQTPAEQDVTANVLVVESMAAEIRDTTLGIANVENEMASTLATSNARIQAIYSLGYIVGGDASDNLKVQVSTEDVLIRAGELTLPRRGLSLTTQDRLGRLNRTVSDYAAEWPGQQAGRDPYNDPTDTGYGGLRHTAPYEGSWRAQDGICKLISSNNEGVAASTLVSDALCGSAQTGFRLDTTSKGEYAGIAFRIFDKDNLFFVVYYLDDDVIKLVRRVGSQEAVLATSSSMSWAVDTWYWLKVRVHYGMVYVYTSTDGITFSGPLSWSAGSGELPGQPQWEGTTAYVWSGKFGLIGYGYSDEDKWDSWKPDPWPGPSTEPDNYGTGVMSEGELARCFNFFDLTVTAAWEDIKGTITGTLYHIAIGGGRQAWVTSADGLWYTADIAASTITWSCIKTASAAQSETGLSGQFLAVGLTPANRVYAPWHGGQHVNRGFYHGTAGSVSYHAFPQYDPPGPLGPQPIGCGTARRGYCVYCGDGIPRIGCGAGSNGRALLWTDDTYIQFANDDDGNQVTCIRNGHLTTWNGELYGNYDPANLLYSMNTPPEYGFDVFSGSVLYYTNAAHDVYCDGVLLATAESVWGVGEEFGRVIFVRNSVNQMAAVVAGEALGGTPNKFVVYTRNRFADFHDRTGDFKTSVGTWSGDTAATDFGNASLFTFPYSDEEYP
jgi:hypothetical protein